MSSFYSRQMKMILGIFVFIAIFSNSLFLVSKVKAFDSFDEKLTQMINETRMLSPEDLKELSKKELNALKKGKVLTEQAPIIDRNGKELMSRLVKSISILKTPPKSAQEIFLHSDRWSYILAPNVETIVLEKGNSPDYVIFYEEIRIPFIETIRTYTKIISEENDIDGDGIIDNYFIWYHLDDTYRLTDKKGNLIEPNCPYNYGSWNIYPWNGGKDSLVFFTIMTEPGFEITRWFWNKLYERIAVPTLLKEFESAGKIKLFKIVDSM